MDYFSSVEHLNDGDFGGECIITCGYDSVSTPVFSFAK